MKKVFLITASVLSLAFLALAFVSPTQAAGPADDGPGSDRPGRAGTGGYWNEDRPGIPREMNLQLDGVLEEEIHDYLADALGITVEELEDREAAGETAADIALAQGYTLDEFQTLMDEAKAQALAQAVEDGTLTQEEAEWYSSRGDRRGRRMNPGDMPDRPQDCDQDGLRERPLDGSRGGRYGQQ